MDQFIVNHELKDLTIREYLEYFHINKKTINHIIHDKLYLVSGQIKDQIQENDVILFLDGAFFEKEVDPLFQPLDIVYEDDYLLIVNKPRNLIIHSGEYTLDKMVAGYLKKIGLKPVPRHIFRLDKDTTGLIIYAKDILTLSKLSYDLENNLINKEYLCYCYGKCEEKGLIDLKIGKDRHNNNKMCIYKNGLSAITKYQLLSFDGKYSKVLVNLITGRTHQIRLHLSAINHPLLGDNIYGKDDNFDLKLQCFRLNFIHPHNKKNLTITVRSELSLYGGSDRI